MAQDTLCMGYADAVAQLHNGYGEGLAFSMLEASGTVLQVFSNDNTGTWTMVHLYASGLACLVTHGTAIEVVAPKGDL